jgi:hypothetical protein
MDGTAPHEDILEGCAPSCATTIRAHADAAAPVLPPFQVCSPASRARPSKGLIARGTLVPAWNWLSQTLAAGEDRHKAPQGAGAGAQA